MKITRIVALAVLLAVPSLVSAQTSGTLTTQTAQNWTTAPWVITSGAGAFPDGGGVATWDTVVNTTIGTVAAGATITLNAPITLSGITWNSPFSMTLAGSAVNNLALSASGAAFNVQLSIANTPTLFQLANSITAPITGGGSAGITKTGNGTMTLGATVASTYTGGTHINGGLIVISATAAIGDSVLGASGVGNGISMDGGALFNNITGGWTTSRDISLGAGGGTIYTNTNATINGVISGSGSLNDNGFATAAGLILTNINTYTGATITSSSPVSLLTLSGNGSIATSASYDFAGTVNLSNTATNVNDRLNDAGAISMHGATLTLTGNATAATSEAAGVMSLANGTNIITVTPNAAQATSLNFAGITRQNSSSLFVRGTSLGAATGAGVAQVNSVTSPGTLLGGGGSAGSTNISILPWVIGNTSATATTGSSFVTYGAGTGLRPLATAEYAAAFGGGATDNVRITATTAAPTTTVNSLLFAPAAAATLSGGPITMTSGGFLYSPTVSSTGTVSAGLDFGSAEGVISTSDTLNISGVISGSNGITINPFNSSTVTLTGLNTYTGQTVLLNGITQYSGTITNDGTPSVFGMGTSASSPIVFNGGNGTTRLWATAASIINRDIVVLAGGSGALDLGTSGTTYTVTVNGNVSLGRTLSLDGGSTATAAMIMNGAISGAGGLSDLSSSFNILNGNNTYSGGTNIQTGTYAAGSNTAFGVGTIYFSNTGKVQSADATAHTLGNDIFLGANPTFQGTGALTFSGGVNLNGARSFSVTSTAAAGVAFSGVVANGALTKTGTGLLALNSSTGNTYTGGTVLGNNGGILNVNNVSGSGTGSGTVSIGGSTVANRSTLSGNFTISGATLISGTLSPGNSAGTANFGSSLTLAVNSNSVIEIASAASFDHINVAGLLTLPNSATAGSFTFSISTIGGYDAPAGTVFDFVDWGTLAAGTFNPATQISFTNAPGSTNTTLDTSNFLVNGTVTVIPEPSTWTMIGAGASMLVAMMRLRRRSS